MARKPDPQVRAAWAARIGRFQQSSLTVVDFCATEGVSVAAFYQWRRKLRREDSAPAFLPLVVADRPRQAAPEADFVAPMPARSRQPIHMKLPGGVAVTVDEHTGQERLTEVLVATIRAAAIARVPVEPDSTAGGEPC